MYLAVVFLIFDQASILGNVVLFGYGMLVWLACHVFVSAYEEPILWKTFGTEYDAFCANVPRWRLRTSLAPEPPRETFGR
jgi:protein-S-isoprenylcysteine O-methyltransferase Ste14